MWRFASAGVVFGARLTVAMHAGCSANAKIIAEPKEDIGRPKKAKRTTGRLKIVVVTA
jgi:hypothetical protein